MKCKICKGQLKTGKQYCSSSCFNKRNNNLKNKKCIKCGTLFIVKNLAYIKRGGGKYCSRNCSRFSTKKFSSNENYFSNIDSEFKAYWLGFLMADGFNSGNEIVLELAEKDIKHIEKFKKELQSNNPITTRTRNNRNYSTIRISSTKICKDLTTLGCTKCKSLTLQFPNIDKNLESHFIRGVFDGDGCCSIIKNYNRVCFNLFSASLKFLEKIKKIINTYINDHIPIYSTKSGFTLNTTKKSLTKSIFHFLYDNATIFLPRKKEKFEILFKTH